MITVESARSWYPASDPVHGFDHVLRVYHAAERLAEIEGADLEIVRAAALLHDASSEQWSIFARKDRPSTVDSDQQSAILNQQSSINNPRLTHHHASADFAAQ